MENEFDIVDDYLEFLSEKGIDESTKDNNTIDIYINEYEKHDYLSKSRKTLFRWAINR